ncbi:VOC family protein [Streptomyces zagrosensis]|uniref:Catechol 2,3-dioxygenase-like lactoylglutathione lyase family enzyme n=1 Tax=Streptomyces zagrosensis TaxID=1042984 RepID=A0A7W9UYX9_9ACTN|nr:VOC family protein [Streptomyces zagrosensis]MBB5935219.1 catechol 2,3-dioxygenase-like lactoylglutathione lyase family enzyme [Streptomyces zagrosensis]
MPARLDHTIMHSTDSAVSAHFLTDLLGAPEPKPQGPFVAVPVEGGLTIDYADFIVEPDHIVLQHLAFLVSEEEFDQIYSRVQGRELPYWSEPGHEGPQQLNHRSGGRGLYVDDPDGHAIEFLTVSETQAS